MGGKCIDKIPVDYTIAMTEPEAMAQTATSMMKKGYRTFVVKTGTDTPVATSRVKAVRYNLEWFNSREPFSFPVAPLAAWESS